MYMHVYCYCSYFLLYQKCFLLFPIHMDNIPVKEVLGDNIISAQLDSHRVSIEKNEYSSPVVTNGTPHNLHQYYEIMS